MAGFGGSVIFWQNAASPVVEDGLVFVNANSPTAALMAFNADSGALVWRAQDEQMTHATPILTTLHGMRQLIWATQSGLVSVNPQTGARIWKAPYPFGYTTSLAASPAMDQDYVFLSAFYGMGAFAFQILLTNSVQTPVLRWANSAMALQNHWSTPVCFQGVVVGQFTPDHSGAQLKCLNLSNGTTNWVANNIGRGNVIRVGTNLLIITERCDLILAAASTNAYTELRRFQAIPNYQEGGNKCWNALALSDGQLYVRSTAYVARYDLSLPDLTLDPPRLTTAARLDLTIRTATGAPVDSNRLNGIEVRAGTNLALSPWQWPKLTNSLSLSNGVVRVTNVNATLPSQFFIVSEPK